MPDTQVETPELSFDQIRTALRREAVEAPASAAPAKEPAATQDPSGAPGDKPAAETAEGSDPSKQETKRDDKGQFKADDVPAGVQKRIDKAVAKQRDAERRAEDAERQLAELRAGKPADKPAQETEPKGEDFATHDEWVRAVAKWELKQARETEARENAQRAAGEARQAMQEKWNASEEAFMDQHDDYEEVAESVKIPQSVQGQVLGQTILESDIGPQLLYHLGQNPDVVQKLMKLTPARLAMEVGRIEVSLTKPPETQKPKVTSAPKPPTTVKGSPAVEVDLDSCDMHTFAKEIKKHLRPSA